MRQKLADLKTRYTDKHPDIIRLKKQIDVLQSDSATLTISVSNNEELPISSNRAIDFVEQQRQNRNEIRLSITAIKRDISNLDDLIATYKERIENTPKREQELLALKRDYENIKNTYDSLLNRKLESEIALHMEKKQKGEQFQIFDPAKLPEKPISPNLKGLFVLSIGAGLGIGIGLIFLIEYFDSSFKKTEDVEPFLGLPVLITIPVLDDFKNRFRRNLNMTASIVSIMISMVLIAMFTVIVVKGVDVSRSYFVQFVTRY